MASDALIYLNHKTRKYNGKTYESFTGSLTIGGRAFVISINAKGGQPVLRMNEYKGKKNKQMIANVNEYDPNKTSGKSNEIH